MRPDRQVGAHLSVFRIFVWDRGNDGLAVCTEKNRHAASVAGIYKEVVDAGLLVDQTVLSQPKPVPSSWTLTKRSSFFFAMLLRFLYRFGNAGGKTGKPPEFQTE